MNVNKSASRRSLTSDLAKMDAHAIKRGEYADLPELDDEMLACAQINKGGWFVFKNRRKLLSL